MDRPALKGKFYQIGGPDTVTGDILAEKLSVAIGRPVQYQAIPEAAFREQLKQFMPEAVANAISEQSEYEATKGAHLLSPPPDVPLADLPVPLTSIDAWAKNQDWTLGDELSAR